jgi:hypothetical protein
MKTAAEYSPGQRDDLQAKKNSPEATWAAGELLSKQQIR